MDVSKLEDCVLCRLTSKKLTDTVTKEKSSKENHLNGEELSYSSNFI